jgi:hypothetical protein
MLYWHDSIPDAEYWPAIAEIPLAPYSPMPIDEVIQIASVFDRCSYS